MKIVPTSHIFRLVLLRTPVSLTAKSLSTASFQLKEQTRDLVSPPHPVSNLRLIKYAADPNETAIEKEFRIRRIKLQSWNQVYWQTNNALFQKEKSEFIKNTLKKAPNQTMPDDDLALFYKKFLDANHLKHMTYNLEWYKRHVALLWPAFRAFLSRTKRKLFER